MGVSELPGLFSCLYQPREDSSALGPQSGSSLGSNPCSYCQLRKALGALPGLSPVVYPK